MATRAAIRYAKALLGHASESGNKEAVYYDMKAVVATLDSSKELKVVLNSPIIKGSDKKEALSQVFNGAKKETLSLVDLLVQNNRADLLESVANAYIHLYNESQGIVVAQVTTAVELNKELEDKILDKVKSISGSEKARLEHHIDPAIIGGFVLRVGDVQYDASIANQLNKVQKEFTKRL